jgi:hypothetical protein
MQSPSGCRNVKSLLDATTQESYLPKVVSDDTLGRQNPTEMGAGLRAQQSSLFNTVPLLEVGQKCEPTLLGVFSLDLLQACVSRVVVSL